MSTQQSINNCVSRIEKQLNSKNPNLEVVHTELGFLDKLISLDMNGITIDASGPKSPKEDKNNSSLVQNVEMGDVIIFTDINTNIENFKKVLRDDKDWWSVNYKEHISEDPNEAYLASPFQQYASRTSKYTLATGEIAYLIRVN